MSAFKISFILFAVIVLTSSFPTSSNQEARSDIFQFKRNTNEEFVPLGRRLRELLGRASRFDGTTLDSDSAVFVPGERGTLEDDPFYATDDDSFPGSQLDSDTYETDRSFTKRRIRYKPMH